MTDDTEAKKLKPIVLEEMFLFVSEAATPEVPDVKMERIISIATDQGAAPLMTSNATIAETMKKTAQECANQANTTVRMVHLKEREVVAEFTPSKIVIPTPQVLSDLSTKLKKGE